VIGPLLVSARRIADLSINDLPVPDGGWAAFDKDCTKSILEKVPFADHNAMLDPECVDITARILEVLGYEGFGHGSSAGEARPGLHPRPRNPTARSSAAGG
jgi:hypothetical protein